MAGDPSDKVALLGVMREAFAQRDFGDTVELFQRLTDLGKMPRNIRIEATCLAARALIASKNRSAARALLKPLLEHEYPKAAHYDHLAHAFLDLKNYKETQRLCLLAANIQETQKKT